MRKVILMKMFLCNDSLRLPCSRRNLKSFQFRTTFVQKNSKWNDLPLIIFTSIFIFLLTYYDVLLVTNKTSQLFLKLNSLLLFCEKLVIINLILKLNSLWFLGAGPGGQRCSSGAGRRGSGSEEDRASVGRRLAVWSRPVSLLRWHLPARRWAQTNRP